jgi:hypothetical protein
MNRLKLTPEETAIVREAIEEAREAERAVNRVVACIHRAHGLEGTHMLSQDCTEFLEGPPTPAKGGK